MTDDFLKLAKRDRVTLIAALLWWRDVEKGSSAWEAALKIEPGVRPFGEDDIGIDELILRMNDLNLTV